MQAKERELCSAPCLIKCFYGRQVGASNQNKIAVITGLTSARRLITSCQCSYICVRDHFCVLITGCRGDLRLIISF